MKTTKQLIKQLENRSAFWFTWAIMWRWVVMIFTAYLIAIVIALLIASLIN